MKITFFRLKKKIGLSTKGGYHWARLSKSGSYVGSLKVGEIVDRRIRS